MASFADTVRRSLMRCKACNVALSDQESTRKYIDSEEYTDLCNTCYYTTDEDCGDYTISRADSVQIDGGN